MNLLTLIGSIFKFFLEIFALWNENRIEVKERKKEALKNAIDAISERDASKFNRNLHWLR